MALSLKKILVIDVEATCWANKEEKPAGQESEIIEIGGALVDLKQGTILDNFGIIVKPIESVVTPFCTQLTTLTQKDVDQGEPFEEACNHLVQKYKSDKIAWASWGDYDREMFRKVCQRRKLQYPFNKTHFNVKMMHALLTGKERGVGMDEALREYDMDLRGTHHRGIDDAYNIARLLLKIIYSKHIVCPYDKKYGRKEPR